MPVAKIPKETLDQEGKEADKSIHGSSYDIRGIYKKVPNTPHKVHKN